MKDNCHLINSTSLPTAYPFTLFADVTLTDSMSDEPRFMSFIGDSGTQYYAIGYSFSISSFRVLSRNGGGQNVFDSSNYSLGNHKVAAIFTETEVKMFVDGNNEGNIANTILFPSHDQARAVGKTNAWFNGLLALESPCILNWPKTRLSNAEENKIVFAIFP